MSTKVFLITLTVLAVGVVGYMVVSRPKHPLPARLGVAQPDYGRQHIAPNQKQTYQQAIPTSGPHTNEAPWGYSAVQLPNEQIIHNMEHGGVVVSYRPDLDLATINKLKGLFTPPYADKSFTPTKAIVMPRAGQTKPIVLASWDRLLELNSYNQQTLVDYYLTNVGKSPEPNAN